MAGRRARAAAGHSFAAPQLCDKRSGFPAAAFGRWHDRPVGPHADWSFQIAFAPALLALLLPWLALTAAVLGLMGALVWSYRRAVGRGAKWALWFRDAMPWNRA